MSAAETLLSLLAREKTALLAGHLDALTPIGVEKLRLADALAGARVDLVTARALRRQSLHNGRLIAAAISGLKAAHQRLMPQNRAATTYDQAGRLAPLQGGSNSNSRV